MSSILSRKQSITDETLHILKDTELRFHEVDPRDRIEEKFVAKIPGLDKHIPRLIWLTTHKC